MRKPPEPRSPKPAPTDPRPALVTKPSTPSPNRPKPRPPPPGGAFPHPIIGNTNEDVIGKINDGLHLFGVRESLDYRDTVYIGGFDSGCHASRARKSSLIVPGGGPVIERVEGDAVTVLHTAVSDWLI
jgi:hypothetical protein